MDECSGLSVHEGSAKPSSDELQCLANELDHAKRQNTYAAVLIRLLRSDHGHAVSLFQLESTGIESEDDMQHAGAEESRGI